MARCRLGTPCGRVKLCSRRSPADHYTISQHSLVTDRTAFESHKQLSANKRILIIMLLTTSIKLHGATRSSETVSTDLIYLSLSSCARHHNLTLTTHSGFNSFGNGLLNQKLMLSRDDKIVHVFFILLFSFFFSLFHKWINPLKYFWL